MAKPGYDFQAPWVLQWWEGVMLSHQLVICNEDDRRV